MSIFWVSGNDDYFPSLAERMLTHQLGLHAGTQMVDCSILAPISKVDPGQNAVLFCGTPVIRLSFIIFTYRNVFAHARYTYLIRALKLFVCNH